MIAVALLAALSLQERLVRVDNALKAGQFESAGRDLAALTTAIGEHFASGPQAMYTVGVIASFHAIAAAGEGNAADAEWYWSAARSFYPKFAGSDLHAYGAAGAAVMRIDASDVCAIPDLSGSVHVTPPKPVAAPMPNYPYHALETGIAEPVTVEVIVTAEGTTRCPRVVETHENPSLAWVLLEAMKRWRYEPAMADGGRVAAAVRQTVDFRIKYY